jgi:phage head maturation protease
MEITKSNWTTSGNNIKLSIPFSKVDQSKRTVSGYATLDNVDSHGDIVSSEASLGAFMRFRGNVREMHQPMAVGKVVAFEPKSYYDPKEGKVYNGVYVTSYVSKGAQDTWEKVLDGTLSGFSIGGSIKESDNEVQEGSDTLVRVIKNYDLVELSLVDNPANQLANIFSIEKVNGSMVMKGIAASVIPENIFWCPTDAIAITSENDTATCDNCSCNMEQIGWVESTDVSKAETIKTIVDTYIKKNSEVENIAEERRETNDGVDLLNKDNEGDTEVAENTEVVDAPAADEVVVAPAAEEVVEAAEVAADAPVVEEEAIEKAADIQEVAVEELDFAKKLDELKSFFADNFAKNASENATGLESVRSNVEELVKSAEAKIEDLAKKYDEISGIVKGMTDSLETTEKRIDSVETSTAIKKSADLGGSNDEPIKKSKWNGTFLGVREIL